MKKSELKILFSEPVSSLNAVWGKFGKDSGTNNFLYGVASIAAYCRSKGFTNIKFLDPNLEGIPKESYIDFLKKHQFDVAAMSSFTASATHIFETFKIIKETLPSCLTVLGGVHATLLPEESMEEYAYIDVTVVGEGEITFCELMECITTKKDLSQVKGIVWRNKEKIIRNKPQELIQDTNILPMPAYDLFPMKKYRAQATHSKVFPTYTMLVSRGCCYNCAFCNATDVHGKRVRYKSPDAVIEEMIYLKERFGARGITFYDSTFTINKKWIREFCSKLIKKKVNLVWECSTRTDAIDEELLRLMKRAGCWSLSFGIESGNQKSLDLIRKNNTVEKNTEGIRLALKLGFFVATTYIICLPGEDEKDVLNTIKYAKKTGAHQALFYLPIPFPKTHLYDICKADGGLNENTIWTDYNSLNFDNPVYVNPKIGKEKMIKLYNYAFKSYYRAPKVILRNLSQITSKDALIKYFMAMKCYLKFK